MSTLHEEVNRPALTIRHGRIKATIWCNQTNKGPMYNVTFTRSYQDEQERWHDSQSFGIGDLMTVAKCAFDSHTWISGELAANASDDKTDDKKDQRGNPQKKASPSVAAEVPH